MPRLFRGATAASQSQPPARVGLVGAASDRRVHAFRNTRSNRTHTARAGAALPSGHRAAPCSGMECYGQRCWIGFLVGAVSRGRRYHLTMGPERAHPDSDGVPEWMSAGPGWPCPQPVGTCTRLAPLHAEPLAGARNHAGGYGQAGIWVLAELACVACHAGLWFVGGGVGRSGLTSGWRGRARVLPDILARRAPTSAVARREKDARLLAIDRVGAAE